MDVPVQWDQILNDYAALERENARLRRLLDEIHRGESERPRVPKRYDEATQAREDA